VKSSSIIILFVDALYESADFIASCLTFLFSLKPKDLGVGPNIRPPPPAVAVSQFLAATDDSARRTSACSWGRGRGRGAGGDDQPGTAQTTRIDSKSDVIEGGGDSRRHTVNV
jgi:hypothetical protein